ncbi:hypothetical protein SAMN05421693_1403 [Ectothiorhodospira magna]|uniref:Uncharacterized protein n=1 Tax=Ectothiorhodospira magna TaxID=867345 RepID=A0A1H9GLC2_9GAMM|nr:hypothetical protein [Ectothiorhodospira magna]SEQ50870.1 hypothetical protein SAMN05421693_1403 [Ectothiorhodospira magna]
MKHFDPSGIIRILNEKNVRFGSKGSRQWELLKKFNGRTVSDFSYAAQEANRTSAAGTYQTSNWWVRELDYCWNHRVIRIDTLEITSLKMREEQLALKEQQTLSAENSVKKITHDDLSAEECLNSSGIYVAIPLSSRLMPVTRDPRYVNDCARVNNLNVKIGKARSFTVRQRNYWADFDPENIEFVPIAKVEDIQQAETAILRKLDSFRLISPKGGKMDWLVGIEACLVVSNAYEALRAEGIDYQIIYNRFLKTDMQSSNRQ